MSYSVPETVATGRPWQVLRSVAVWANYKRNAAVLPVGKSGRVGRREILLSLSCRLLYCFQVVSWLVLTVLLIVRSAYYVVKWYNSTYFIDAREFQVLPVRYPICNRSSTSTTPALPLPASSANIVLCVVILFLVQCCNRCEYGLVFYFAICGYGLPLRVSRVSTLTSLSFLWGRGYLYFVHSESFRSVRFAA